MSVSSISLLEWYHLIFVLSVMGILFYIIDCCITKRSDSGLLYDERHKAKELLIVKIRETPYDDLDDDLKKSIDDCVDEMYDEEQ